MLPTCRPCTVPATTGRVAPASWTTRWAAGSGAAGIVALASQDQLEVATLTIDGRLAAQVIGVVEPAAYRVLEGFMVTELIALLGRATARSRCAATVPGRPGQDPLDWMTSVAPESLLAANALQPVSVVRAAW